MANQDFKVRYFFVGEDECLNRIPLARYQRIFQRAQPIRLYAGKSLRFIEAVVERDDAGRERLIHACILRHQFDEHGLWDEDDKERNIRNAMEALSALGKGQYMLELYTAEYIDPFRWRPSADLLKPLREAIRTRRKHI